MKVICKDCNKIYDWNDKDVFCIPYGQGFNHGKMISFRCKKHLIEAGHKIEKGRVIPMKFRDLWKR